MSNNISWSTAHPRLSPHPPPPCPRCHLLPPPPHPYSNQPSTLSKLGTRVQTLECQAFWHAKEHDNKDQHNINI